MGWQEARRERRTRIRARRMSRRRAQKAPTEMPIMAAEEREGVGEDADGVWEVEVEVGVEIWVVVGRGTTEVSISSFQRRELGESAFEKEGLVDLPSL